MEMELLEKSREYIREGQMEKAQIILRRILSENPNEAKALEISGDLALKQGRINEAIQRYDNASNKYTNDNRYAEAIICLEKIKMLDKTNEEVFSRLADLYRFYGLPNKAVTTILDLCGWAINEKKDAVFVSALRKIVELQPKNLELRFSFAKILLSVERTQEAEDELKKIKSLAEEAGKSELVEEVAKLLPQTDGGEELDPKSRIELGNLLYEIGSKDEALVEFNKAVSDLLESGETEDALNVLNRIVEIDPNNKEAINKIKELTGESVVEEPEQKEEEETSEAATEEEIVAEAPSETPEEVVEESVPEAEVEQAPEAGESEAPPEEKTEEAAEEPSAEAEPTGEAMEMFQDLGQDIEGFVPATDSSETAVKEEEAPETETEEKPDDEISKLEGQIADIEFLLKETETIAKPKFEIAKEFDDFRNRIVWQDEDVNKKLKLAETAFNNELYETALAYIQDINSNKETWPLSLEITGRCLIKLGRYNEAKKSLAGFLLIDEISEEDKMELRYLLASAYEGLGDFDNAMREIERILSINPDYKDVKEIYALMGGKEFEVPEKTVEKVVEQEPAVRKEIPQSAPEPQTPPTEPTAPRITESAPPEGNYPTIIEEIPQYEEPITQPPLSEKPQRKLKEEIPDIEEPKGENIAFL